MVTSEASRHLHPEVLPPGHLREPIRPIPLKLHGRYARAERGSRVMLFVREENKRGGVTLPFLCLGFADYVSHQGERPMAIRWRLQRAIPAAFVPEVALAV
jgi:hypothetical protein